MRRTTPLTSLLLLLLPLGLAGQASDVEGSPFTPDTIDVPSAAITSGTSAEDAQIFLGVFRAIRHFHLEGLDDSGLWRKALQGLIRELEDPYATVLTPEQFSEFQEDNTGDYAGIGVQITELNGAITVTAVFRGAPADRAGLQVGDRIVGVDGVETEAWSVSEASEKIRGRVGTTVEIHVAREGYEQPVPHLIERDQVHVSAVSADRIGDDLGYIHVDRVARGATEEVDSALSLLSGTRGIILDLRRNPGGFLEESLSLSDLFLEPGQVVASTRSRVPGDSLLAYQEDAYEARHPARAPDVPLIVLVDRFTASAAEILAGALQDHDRAVVLGERTFGKGSVQSLVPLPADHQLRLTTGEWYTPLGRSLNRERDEQGGTLPDRNTGATVVTEAGRELRGGGGIFPDLDITQDTLTGAEQELVSAAVREQIPLTLRITEFAFEEAQRVRELGESSWDLRDGAFGELAEELVGEGLSSDIVESPEARSYLEWRLRAELARRLDDLRRELEVRAEKDRALAAALRLLGEASTQSDLFAAVRDAGLHQDSRTTSDLEG